MFEAQNWVQASGMLLLLRVAQTGCGDALGAPDPADGARILMRAGGPW